MEAGAGPPQNHKALNNLLITLVDRERKPFSQHKSVFSLTLQGFWLLGYVRSGGAHRGRVWGSKWMDLSHWRRLPLQRPDRSFASYFGTVCIFAALSISKAYLFSLSQKGEVSMKSPLPTPTAFSAVGFSTLADGKTVRPSLASNGPPHTRSFEYRASQLCQGPSTEMSGQSRCTFMTWSPTSGSPAGNNSPHREGT